MEWIENASLLFLDQFFDKIDIVLKGSKVCYWIKVNRANAIPVLEHIHRQAKKSYAG